MSIYITNKIRKAFTLTEVLITLSIIGVIAAMTLPTVINKYQEHVTVNKVAKWYSMMSQAIILSINDNGYPNSWNVIDGANWQSATQLASYIKPYLKVIKDCKTNSNCLDKTTVTYLKGGGGISYDKSVNYYKMILSDNSYIWIKGPENTYCKSSSAGHNDVCGIIYIDINGGKSPNTWGKDVFMAYLTPTGLKPPANSEDCKLNNNGASCLNFILLNGNMKYPEQ